MVTSHSVLDAVHLRATRRIEKIVPTDIIGNDGEHRFTAVGPEDVPGRKQPEDWVCYCGAARLEFAVARLGSFRFAGASDSLNRCCAHQLVSSIRSMTPVMLSWPTDRYRCFS